jgi:hypothetical protein
MSRDYSADIALQRDVDAFALSLTSLLAELPRKFVSRFKSDQVQVFGVERENPEETIEVCAQLLAEQIEKAAKGKAIQFSRGTGVMWEDGIVRAGSSSWDLVPVMAMCAPDVVRGKLIQRFDVRLILHDA